MPNAPRQMLALAPMLAEKRQWQQYHRPKNLVMALSVEVAELMEHFQWLTPDESEALDEEQIELVSMEMADVLLYLGRMADVLGVDLYSAAQKKLKYNAARFPA